jgi:chaperonin GroES
MSKLAIKPLGDRVLVEPIAAEKGGKKSAIIMPETIDKERPEQGKVVAVGDGWYTEDGDLVPLRVKKGQTVLFSKYGPDEIKFEGKEYFVIKESNILAIIE